MLTVREETYSGRASATQTVQLPLGSDRVCAIRPKPLLGKPAMGPAAGHWQWVLTPENRWKDTNNAQGDRCHEFKNVPDPFNSPKPRHRPEAIRTVEKNTAPETKTTYPRGSMMDIRLKRDRSPLFLPVLCFS